MGSAIGGTEADPAVCGSTSTAPAVRRVIIDARFGAGGGRYGLNPTYSPSGKSRASACQRAVEKSPVCRPALISSNKKSKIAKNKMPTGAAAGT